MEPSAENSSNLSLSNHVKEALFQQTEDGYWVAAHVMSHLYDAIYSMRQASLELSDRLGTIASVVPGFAENIEELRESMEEMDHVLKRSGIFVDPETLVLDEERLAHMFD